MHITPLGDRALTVTLGATVDEATRRRVRAACARLAERPVPGVLELVPAFASVTVHYDPARVPPGLPPAGPDAGSPFARLAAALGAALADADDAPLPPSAVVEIPVVYGGASGPDLDALAHRHGMTPDEVVRLHAAGEYVVHMVGFLPGFAYLGGLDPRLATPRRDAPRAAVPAGSVGIGGQQTGVYPLESPGGWHLIGRTALRMFDPRRDPPTLLHAGDRVRFRAVDA
jgi:inhibitor of KinA